MSTTIADKVVLFGAGVFVGLAAGMPLGLAIATPKAAETTPAAVTAQPCEEDQPCWDCTTMGNRICGPGMAPPMDYGLPVYAVTVSAR